MPYLYPQAKNDRCYSCGKPATIHVSDAERAECSDRAARGVVREHRIHRGPRPTCDCVACKIGRAAFRHWAGGIYDAA